MIGFTSFRRGSGVAVAVLLAGCSTPWPSAAPPALPANRQTPKIGQSDFGNIKKLIYVSRLDRGTVDVFNYATGDHVASLSGVRNPQGQCVDAKGDVYVTVYAGSVVEYERGGHKPIKTLQISGNPTACSVSAQNDLSVINVRTNSTNQSEVILYKNGSGSPATYTNTSCFGMYQISYDRNGNLYILGAPYTASYKAQVCVLRKGASAIQTVTSNADLSHPLGVMWDGKHITLGNDPSNLSANKTVIYQMKEDESGNLTVIGTTTLTDPSCQLGALLSQPIIVGTKNTPVNTQVGTTVAGVNDSCGRFEFWPYPKGGPPARYLKAVLSHSSGQTVSIAP